MSEPFNSIQILDIRLENEVGFNALWSAGLRNLPEEDVDAHNPVVAKVTDGDGRQIAVTRIGGVPVLIDGKDIPHRFNQVAYDFRCRWDMTPANAQNVITSSG